MADKLMGRKGNATQDQLLTLNARLDEKDPLFDSESEVIS